MKRTITVALSFCFFLLASILTVSPAKALTFSFDGYITYHNDVVPINFTLNNDAANVRLWTDSFNSNANFDPILALWDSTGTLLAQNDDNPYVGVGQTYYDSGFFLSSLPAGDYIVTIARFSNFAWGPTLAQGFYRDGDTPFPFSEGGYYRIWLDGVDRATSPSPTPEPATCLLFLFGVVGLAGAKKRFS